MPCYPKTKRYFLCPGNHLPHCIDESLSNSILNRKKPHSPIADSTLSTPSSERVTKRLAWLLINVGFFASQLTVILTLCASGEQVTTELSAQHGLSSSSTGINYIAFALFLRDRLSSIIHETCSVSTKENDISSDSKKLLIYGCTPARGCVDRNTANTLCRAAFVKLDLSGEDIRWKPY